MLNPLGRRIPWLCEEGIHLVHAIHKIVCIGAAPVRTNEREHCTLHVQRQLNSLLCGRSPGGGGHLGCLHTMVCMQIHIEGDVAHKRRPDALRVGQLGLCALRIAQLVGQFPPGDDLAKLAGFYIFPIQGV